MKCLKKTLKKDFLTFQLVAIKNCNNKSEPQLSLKECRVDMRYIYHAVALS